MKSPFPGMDPYLEQYWRDVHHRLCTYACDALQPQVRPALLARIEERLVVESDDGYERSIYPDVKLAERFPRAAANTGGGGAATAAVAEIDEPLLVAVSGEKPTEGFIEIIDPTTGGKLITVIEFLSPSNKTTVEGRRQYKAKQKELADAGVSLVEIDLVRAGGWVLQVPRSNLPASHRTPYRICVHRGWDGFRFEVYRAPLNSRLPTIRIPLRQGDADAKLNLQALIDQTYENGAYDQIDYRRDALPPLEGEYAAWAEARLKEQNRR